MRLVAKLAFAFCALVAGAAAQAQPYPSRPISMIVPFAPGGIADITGRLLAVPLARILGQPVVIDNRAGAGGAVGHVATAKAKPDGYTIMMALSSIVVIPEAEKSTAGSRPTRCRISLRLHWCPPTRRY